VPNRTLIGEGPLHETSITITSESNAGIDCQVLKVCVSVENVDRAGNLREEASYCTLHPIQGVGPIRSVSEKVRASRDRDRQLRRIDMQPGRYSVEFHGIDVDVVEPCVSDQDIEAGIVHRIRFVKREKVY
jgi:hypothetical protein